VVLSVDSRDFSRLSWSKTNVAPPHKFATLKRMTHQKVFFRKYLSKVTFERNLARVSWKRSQFFFFRNKLSWLEHVLFLQIFFRKSLSSVSLPWLVTVLKERVGCRLDWWWVKSCLLNSVKWHIQHSKGHSAFYLVSNFAGQRTPKDDLPWWKMCLSTECMCTRVRPIRVKPPMSDVPIFRRKNSDVRCIFVRSCETMQARRATVGVGDS